MAHPGRIWHFRLLLASSALLVGVPLLVAGCGGGKDPTPASSRAALRYANVEVVHQTVGGTPRVRLRTVIEGGGVVMTAIGSDADTGEADGLKWTTMRAALLVQLKSAMKALGWQEVGSGPAWWQVRFSGGPDAKIPVVAPDGESSEAPTEEPTEEPSSAPPVTAEPVPSDTGGEADATVALYELLGRDFDDPAVKAQLRGCPNGTSLHSNIYCDSYELNIGSNGVSNLAVTQITFYNQEGVNGHTRYAGALPAGLDWSMTYEDVIATLGEPATMYNGGGIAYELTYPNIDGYQMVVTLWAGHQADLPGSLMHKIEIRKA